MASIGRSLCVVITLLCAGCSGSKGGPDTSEGEHFRGRAIGELILHSGVPESERTIAGYTVYVWKRELMEKGSSYNCVFEATTKVGSKTIVNTSLAGTFSGCFTLAERMKFR